MARVLVALRPAAKAGQPAWEQTFFFIEKKIHKELFFIEKKIHKNKLFLYINKEKNSRKNFFFTHKELP